MMAQLAREHKKPLMVAEGTAYATGTYFGQQSWDEWFVPFFEFVKNNNVRAVCYINWDWDKIPFFKDQGWGDCRVHVREPFKKLWLEEMKNSRYLMSSPELFRMLGYNAP
jgi:hypothetical protein